MKLTSLKIIFKHKLVKYSAIFCTLLFLTQAHTQEIPIRKDPYGTNKDLKISDKTISFSPGDKITIAYIDIGPQGNPVERANLFTIRPDGTIFHELLGVINLEGLSISEAEDLVNKKLSKYFTKPEAAISIIEKTSYKVFLYGEVARIGIISIKPNTTIAELIIQNGGTTPDADISKIAISKRSGSTITFNMERYLYTNDPVNNVILEDGDKVIVPRISTLEKFSQLSENYTLQYGNAIEISINELSLMETKPSQPEAYIIDREGNIFHRLLGLVHLGGVTVRKSQDILTKMAKRYFKEPFVTIDVTKLSSRSVFAFGELSRAGIYPIEGNVRLAEFLATIGGFTRDADLKKIIVTRREGKTIVFDMEKYLFDRVDDKNIYLEDGDRIIVLKKNRGLLYRLADKIRPLTTSLSLITSTIMIYIAIKGI